MVENNIYKSFFITIFSLLIVFINFNKAEASIFSNVFNFYLKGKAVILESEYIDITPFLLKPTQAQSSSSLTEKEVNVSEEGIFLVKSGSLRVSTEKEKYVDGTISIYEVKKGDTIESVAKLFGVSANTIVWANDLESKIIKPGQTLLIFPINGLQYTVKNGGTIQDIADKYKVDAKEIASYNGISLGAILAKGDVLFIPDAEAQITPAVNSTKKIITPRFRNNVIEGYFMKPVAGCIKTQGLHGQYASSVDWGCVIGTPVVAAAAGTVIRSDALGYNGGYGGVVIVSHPNNVQTIYAHLNEANVSVGDRVEQGQVIGTSGNTGRSTGPHLHFETRGTSNPF